MGGPTVTWLEAVLSNATVHPNALPIMKDSLARSLCRYPPALTSPLDNTRDDDVQPCSQSAVN